MVPADMTVFGWSTLLQRYSNFLSHHFSHQLQLQPAQRYFSLTAFQLQPAERGDDECLCGVVEISLSPRKDTAADQLQQIKFPCSSELYAR